MKIKVSVSRDLERAVGLRQLAIHQWNKCKEVTETDECQFYDLSRQILEPLASLFQRYIYLCQLQVDKYELTITTNVSLESRINITFFYFYFVPQPYLLLKYVIGWMILFFLDKFEIKVKL